MIYEVEYWARTSFDDKDVFLEEVEANSEEEAIQIINDRQAIIREHTRVIKDENIYSYTDSERGYSEYKLLKDNISFKHPNTGEWIEAVLYKSLKDGKEYVRQKVDFLSKFKKVE